MDVPASPDRDELLRESEARFRRLADNASDLVFRYRRKPTRALEYVNPAVTAITGYTPEEHCANPDLGWAVVHPEDRPLLRAAMGSPASVPTPLTIRLIRKDGGIIWAEHRMIPIVDGSGEVVAVEGIVRDITQRVLTQQTLEQLIEERTREIERRREVAEGLRETLTVLNSDRSIAEILDHIVGRAIRLLGADAAAIYQLEPSKPVLRIRSARGLDPELHQLARGALAEMRSLLLELRPAALLEMRPADLLRQLAEATMGRSRLPVTVTAEGDGKLPPDVQIALYRIAQEALNNVAKHSGASRCALAVRWDSAGARLTVSDDGRGFDPERVSQDHLGLGIMRERAQAIGAALRIAGGPGRGTTVEVAWEDATAAR